MQRVRVDQRDAFVRTRPNTSAGVFGERIDVFMRQAVGEADAPKVRRSFAVFLQHVERTTVGAGPHAAPAIFEQRSHAAGSDRVRIAGRGNEALHPAVGIEPIETVFRPDPNASAPIAIEHAHLIV